LEIIGRKRPMVLIILDGWGIAPVWGGNAIGIANVSRFDSLVRTYPSTTLEASSEWVGLPPNSPGNSEAGHLNIGAGRVVHQDQPIIDDQIASGQFFQNKVLLEMLDHAVKNNSHIHLMGLLSKTGTHSHINHLYALLQFLKEKNFTNPVYIHLFTDGRDSEPTSGIEMVAEVEQKIKIFGIGQIATLIGRYYAMDRDNRWDRIGRAYNLLTRSQGNQFETAGMAFANSYSRSVTDEFVEPTVIISKSASPQPISDNDSIVFFNFRSDRVRELTKAFLSPEMPEISDRKKLNNLYFATFSLHEEKPLAIQAFSPDVVEDPLAKIWADGGYRQYHTAETEKYAHVTYYLNGSKEAPFSGEDRLMIPSPKEFPTYDLIPEMSAQKVADTLIDALKKNIYDGLVVNFANPDMVGHTGNLKATVQAVEFVDKCLGRVIDQILSLSGTACIFADHGNAEQMVNPRTGEPDTEHTTNPVPFILVSNDEKIRSTKLRSDGKLGSIAPTVMDLMGIEYDRSKKEKSLIINDNTEV
jgi:2,3-bisphosphoglycerate-independent phosphoglycerate mutase